MTRRIHRTLLAALLASGMAVALPENGQVIQGNVQIVQPQNHILQILQSSPTGIINWGSFNIDANQLVQFLQPGAGSALLNRVIGQDPSQILGQIQANGRIFLVNPNGILFGPGSTVNAGSFMATTLSIQDQDFIQGRYNFHQDPGSPLRAVVNQGEIRVTDGGFIALLSPLVDNQGLLVAQQGQVVLGATTQATLQVDARGLLQVSIPDGFQAHAQTSAATPQTVLLTQGQMSDTLAQLVRGSHSEGERIIETAQGIQLVGAEGLLVNQGTVRVDAVQGQAGGILMDSSQATVLTADSLLSASSAHGDAGSIYALSAGSTIQTGAIQARSAAAGDGGFVEVSGRRVHLTRGADLTAPEGKPGHLLIDPDFITIVAAGGTSTPDIFFTDTPASLTVNASALDLPGMTVTLEAALDLTIDSGVQVNLSGATDLVLSANRNFIMSEGSAIIAADPAASVTISAADAFIRDLQLSNINIQASNSLQLIGTASGPPMLLGRPTDTTNIDITAGLILHSGQIEVVGNHVQATESATGPLFLDIGANVSVVASTANVSLTGGGTDLGVVFLEDARLGASSAANIILNSPTSNVNFQDRSSLNLLGPSTVNITTPSGGFFLNTGSSINATDPASVLNADSASAVLTRASLRVPTSNLDIAGTLRLTGPTSGPSSSIIGQPGGSTVFNVTAGGQVRHEEGNFEVVGSHVQLTETAMDEVNFQAGATLNVVATTANVSLAGANGVVFFQDSSLQASSAANIALASNLGNVNFQDRSGLNLAGPATINVTTPTGVFVTNADVSINATDPASRLNVVGAAQTTFGSNLAVPTQNLQLTGTLALANTTVGTPASPTVLNATSGATVITGLTVQGTSADIDLDSSGQLTLSDHSQMHIQPANASVNVTAEDVLYVGINTTLRVDGASDIHLTSDNGDVFLSRDSRLDLVGPSSVTVNSPNGQTTLFEGATINATNPASSVNISAGQELSIEGNLLVPTIDMHSNRLVLLLSGTMGTPGSPTSLNVTGGGMPNGIAVVAGSNLDIQGTHADITLTSADDVFVGQDSTVRILAPTANLVVDGQRTGGDSIFFGVNSTLSANGAANVTLNANTGNVLLREGSLISVAGSGDLRLTAPAGRVNMSDGASLSGNQQAILTARDGMDIGNLRVPTNHLTSTTGSIAFQNSTIGRTGANTVLNVSSPDIAFGLNRTTNVVGSQIQVDLSAGNNVLGSTGSQLNLNGSQSNVNVTAPQLLVFDTITSSGAGNFSFTGGSTRVDTLLSAPGPTSRAELTSSNLDVTAAGLQIGNVTLNAARSVVLTGGTIGRPGSPTRLNGTATFDAIITDNLVLQGSQVDFQLRASHDIVLANNKSVTLEGANNFVRWDAANLNLWGTGSSLSATGPTQLVLLAGTNLFQDVSTSVSLPDAASEINLQSTGTIRVNRITTGGNLSATVTAGNVRLTDQLAANNLTLNVSGELIAQPGSRQPALVGTSALNVTAGRISGQIDDPNSGLVKALAFATGPNAQVRLEVTGTNNTDTGNRAANLLYQFPQSGNLILIHQTGDVLLVNEPAPPEPEPQAPTSQQNGLASEVVQQTDQSVSVLIHPFSPATSSRTQDLTFLTYDNAGLVQDHPVSPNSALVERSIAPPDASPSLSEANELERSIQETAELTATRQVVLDSELSSSSYESYSDWQSLLNGSTVELVVLFPERSASELRQRDSEERARATSLLVIGNDEDADLLFWRKLIEGIILWEE